MDDLGRAEPRGHVEEVDIGDAASAGHGDDFGVGTQLADFSDHLDARFLGHHHVGDDKVGAFAAKQLNAVVAVFRQHHRVTGTAQDAADSLTHRWLVVDQ